MASPDFDHAHQAHFRVVLRGLFGPHQDFSKLAWLPFRSGVEISRLYGDGSGPSAALLRYQPGATIPAHEHGGYEHIFVLSGSQRDDHETYEAGSCVIHGEGTAHAIASDDGCVVLAIWQAAIRFREEETPP